MHTVFTNVDIISTFLTFIASANDARKRDFSPARVAIELETQNLPSTFFIEVMRGFNRAHRPRF